MWTEILFKIFLNLEGCLMFWVFFLKDVGWGCRDDVMSSLHGSFILIPPLSHHAYSVSQLLWGPEGYYSVEAVRRFVWCIMLHVCHFSGPYLTLNLRHQQLLEGFVFNEEASTGKVSYHKVPVWKAQNECCWINTFSRFPFLGFIFKITTFYLECIWIPKVIDHIYTKRRMNNRSLYMVLSLACWGKLRHLHVLLYIQRISCQTSWPYT